MEGKAVLFKKFGLIDSFDIEIDESDPDKLIDMIVALEPTFGGINLEDIKVRQCLLPYMDIGAIIGAYLWGYQPRGYQGRAHIRSIDF
jgi:hypothetical protein